VHEEEQRDVDRYTGAAISEAAAREANASRFDELSRRGLMGIHNCPFFVLWRELKPADLPAD
jgi:hypothetical protein